MTGVRRAKCSCCGTCSDGCYVCTTTTDGCANEDPDAFDSYPHDCGAKPFTFDFTFGNNGTYGEGCCSCGSSTGFNETPSHTDSHTSCDSYTASNWGWYIDSSIDGSFTGGGLNFDYEASGWKKFIVDGGGGGCDAYLYKLGTTTANDCCDCAGRCRTCSNCNFSNFTVSAYALSTNTEGNISPSLTTVEVTDTDDYDAFEVSYEGDSDYVRVQTSASAITFTWVGGTYDGTTCTIPVKNITSVPVSCINSTNKGISATEIASGFIGCCHPLKLSDTNLTSGSSTTIQYNKTENAFYYNFKLHYICFAELGSGATNAAALEDVWDGTNECNSSVGLMGIGAFRFLTFDTEDQPLDMCQCTSELPIDSYYCANESDFSLVAYVGGDFDQCINSAAYSNCGGTCNCFTTGENLTWT